MTNQTAKIVCVFLVGAFIGTMFMTVVSMFIFDDTYLRGVRDSNAKHAEFHKTMENMNVLKWCGSWQDRQHYSLELKNSNVRETET